MEAAAMAEFVNPFTSLGLTEGQMELASVIEDLRAKRQDQLPKLLPTLTKIEIWKKSNGVSRPHQQPRSAGAMKLSACYHHSCRYVLVVQSLRQHTVCAICVNTQAVQ